MFSIILDINLKVLGFNLVFQYWYMLYKINQKLFKHYFELYNISSGNLFLISQWEPQIMVLILEFVVV